VRHDLGVDLCLAYPTGDQLGILGSEVDHYDQIVISRAHIASSPRLGRCAYRRSRPPESDEFMTSGCRVACRPRRTTRGAAWEGEICSAFLAKGTRSGRPSSRLVAVLS
jgi:hypothetical protein